MKRFFSVGALCAVMFALVLTGCDEDTFTVTFNSKGGSNVAAIEKVAAGKTITKPTDDPTKTGFVFDGWYKEDACTNAWDFASDVVTSDITLYAKWTEEVKFFTVTFNSQGGSDVAAIADVAGGTKITQPADPTKDGFDFDYWYKEATCTNIWNFKGNVVTSDITLYAKWAEEGNFIINAQVKDGASYTDDVYEVRAIVDGDVIIAKAPYNNGSFKIRLPKTIDQSLLWPVSEYMEEEGITISDMNAKVCLIESFEAYKNDEYFDGLMQAAFGLQMAYVEYLFADRDVNIIGTAIGELDGIDAEIPVDFDVKLKKGWNAVYTSISILTLSGSVTTTKPSTNIEWMFQSDSPWGAPQKMPKIFKKIGR